MIVEGQWVEGANAYDGYAFAGEVLDVDGSLYLVDDVESLTEVWVDRCEIEEVRGL